VRGTTRHVTIPGVLTALDDSDMLPVMKSPIATDRTTTTVRRQAK
jgi:hypothetical protein